MKWPPYGIIKEIAFIFSDMRHFSNELHSDGGSVDYVTIDYG